MTDLVERLRAHPGIDDTVTVQFRRMVDQRHEAADEIERLRGRGVFGDDGVPRLLVPQTRQVKLDRVNAIAEELLQQLDAFQSNQHHSFVTTQQMAREAATVIRLLQAALQPSGQTRALSQPEGKAEADWSGLPKDIYVTAAWKVDHIFWAGEFCQVPMAIGPEVRYTQAALQPSGQTLPKPGRNDGGEPCGECHLQPGETCDICGAAQEKEKTHEPG